jgi:type II secretory pathway component PulC
MTRWLPVSLVVCSTSIAGAEAPDPLYACHALAADAKVTLAFKPDSSISDLALWITGTTCKNVVFDGVIAKRALKATIVAPNKYTPKQALQLVVDAIESTGLVVTQKPDTIIIKLGPNMPKGCPDVAVAPAPAAPTGTGPTKPEAEEPEADALAAQLDTGIKKLDETHYQVKRTLLDAILNNPMAALKGARVIPAMKNGKQTGVKLYAVRPSSAYAKLGFRNGDTVISVNKLPLIGPDDALEAYTKLREAKKLEVELERAGKPVTLVFTIK